MLYLLCLIGGAALEWTASYLIGKFKLKTIVENEVAVLEAKLAALKKKL